MIDRLLTHLLTVPLSRTRALTLALALALVLYMFHALFQGGGSGSGRKGKKKHASGDFGKGGRKGAKGDKGSGGRGDKGSGGKGDRSSGGKRGGKGGLDVMSLIGEMLGCELADKLFAQRLFVSLGISRRLVVSCFRYFSWFLAVVSRSSGCLYPTTQ